MSRDLKIAIVPDSFKGSLSATQVAEAMRKGVQIALGNRAQTVCIPFADGGEGTLDVLQHVWQMDAHEVQVTDAIGRAREARFGITKDSALAVIEAAQASGLEAVSDVPLQPMRADSYGIGQLILAALDYDIREVVLSLGGSASTDGGSGILRALGARLLDQHGEPVASGGAGLANIHSIDLTEVDSRVYGLRWRLAVDVHNPLTGKLGAAHVFSPQKGASADQVEQLDAGLRHFATLLASSVRTQPEQLMHTAGLGAAGGLALPILALFGGTIEPGGELMAELLSLAHHLADADLILTGEGRIDSQSLRGKVVDTVRSHAPTRADIVVIAGQVDLSYEQLRHHGIRAALSLARGAANLSELIAQAPELICEASANAVGLWGSQRHLLG